MCDLIGRFQGQPRPNHQSWISGLQQAGADGGGGRKAHGASSSAMFRRRGGRAISDPRDSGQSRNFGAAQSTEWVVWMDGWPEQSSPGTIDAEEVTEEKWKWKWKWKRERPRPSRGRDVGGGRRETGGGRREGATWKRLKRLKRRETRCDVVDRWGGGGGTRGGCSGSKRTDPFFFNRKERGANPSGRRPSGDEDWVVPSAMGVLEAPLHWGEQMSAPGGTVHTSSAKKGARPLASRSRGSETLCIFIASSNCIVNCHEKGFFSTQYRASLTTHSLFPCRFPPPFSISVQPPQTLASIGPLSKLSEILEAR